MNVGAEIIGLPDFDDGVFDRTPGAVENPPAKPGNGSDAGRDGVVDNEKIVIAIKRKRVGIVGSFGGRGRQRERLRELSRFGEEQAARADGGGEEVAAVHRHFSGFDVHWCSHVETAY